MSLIPYETKKTLKINTAPLALAGKLHRLQWQWLCKELYFVLVSFCFPLSIFWNGENPAKSSVLEREESKFRSKFVQIPSKVHISKAFTPKGICSMSETIRASKGSRGSKSSRVLSQCLTWSNGNQKQVILDKLWIITTIHEHLI